MRIKLDENLPIAAAGVAVQLGHDIDTVNGERLTSASDSDVQAQRLGALGNPDCPVAVPGGVKACALGRRLRRRP